MSDDVDKQAVPGSSGAPLKVRVVSEAEPVFSNSVTIAHDDFEFHIAFFQILPPLVNPTSEALGPNTQEFEKDVSPVKCVARVIVPRDRIALFVDAVNRNYAKFQERTAKKVVAQATTIQQAGPEAK